MYRRASFGAAVLFAAFLLTACSKDTPPSVRGELTPTDLAAVTLSLSDYGSGYGGLSLDSQSGLLPNDLLVRQSPAGHQEGVEEANTVDLRRTGYARMYEARGSRVAGELLAVASQVEVFQDAGGAGTRRRRRREDPVTFEGLLDFDQTRVVAREQFDVGPLGDAWFGEVTKVRTDPEDPGSVTTWSRVMVRRGNVIARAAIIVSGEDDGRPDAARALAELLDSRLETVLGGGHLDNVELTVRDVRRGAATREPRPLSRRYQRMKQSASVTASDALKALAFYKPARATVAATHIRHSGDTISG